MAHPLSPDHAADISEVESVQPELAPALPNPTLFHPNHVPDFPEEDPEEKPEERPEEEEEELEKEEEVEEEEMYMDLDDEIDEVEVISPYEMMGSSKTPPTKLDTSSDSETEAATVPTTGLTFQLPPPIRRFFGSIYVRGESSSVSYVDDDGDILTPGYMRRDINSIFGRFSSGVEHRVTVLEDRFREYGNAKDREENKRLKREVEETRLSKDQVERDLYRMRVWAHRFYGEMVRVGAVREEGPSEAVDVLATLGETSPHEPRGSPRDSQ
ncbi:hypothetical protein Tco_0044904 [Tanacetum coccineum]